MSAIVVTNQAELDEAVDRRDPSLTIIIDSPEDEQLELRATSSLVAASARSWLLVAGDATVIAQDWATVGARERARVVARDDATVIARQDTWVIAEGRAHVEAWDRAHVEAWDRSVRVVTHGWRVRVGHLPAARRREPRWLKNRPSFRDRGLWVTLPPGARVITNMTPVEMRHL